MNTRLEIEFPVDQRRELSELAAAVGLTSSALTRLGIRWLLMHQEALLGGRMHLPERSSHGAGMRRNLWIMFGLSPCGRRRCGLEKFEKLGAAADASEHDWPAQIAFAEFQRDWPGDPAACAAA